MFVRLVLVACLIALTAGTVWYLQERKTEEIEAMGAHAPPPAAISVVEVQAEQWRQTLFAVGTLAADQGIDVTAPLPGTVIGINFESGQDVRRGDVLLTMDIGIQVAEREGLEASVELRRAQFERAEKLIGQRQIAQSEYDAARAALDEARAALQAKQAYIERKKVYAPFDGTLGIRVADLGTYLEPGDAVVPLQALDPIHADYALPEQHLSRLSRGQTVEVQVPAYPEETFVGRITAFDPGIDPQTRNVRIRATFANPAHRLRPGMFARVSTVVGEAKNVLSLPETAVTYSPYGNTVYVVVHEDEAASVERRQVEIGEVRDGRVEIVAGLALGERVVAVGQNKLRNGMPVSVTDDATAAVLGERP